MRQPCSVIITGIVWQLQCKAFGLNLERERK